MSTKEREHTIYLLFDSEGLNGKGLYYVGYNTYKKVNRIEIDSGTEEDREKLRKKAEKLNEMWINRKK